MSAIYASLAGSLYAHFVTFVSPESFNISFSILLVTMVVFGGKTNIWGALLGAVILTVLPESLRVIKDYDVLAYGVILLLVMVFMPEGIAGWLGSIGVRRRPAQA